MKQLYFLFFLLFFSFLNAQIVTIPDANFKNALLNTECVDTNGDGDADADADLNDDGEIQLTEAEAVLSLDVSFQNITSLEGISSFTNMTTLFCTDNDLTELDLSALVNLEVLGCWDNDEIVALDFSANINLISLECDSNQSLEYLNIQNGNNSNLELMVANNSSNLRCIQVDDVTYANNQTCGDDPIAWCKEPNTIYSEDCSLGISDLEEITFSIYPNPVTNTLILNTKLEYNNVKIYSIQGQLISEENTDEIDVSNLSSGIFFVSITVDGRTITQKFMKV
ncbi:T9SS type A sorting domain-containing protein [Marixanthomonas ophiurae]|uniref:T9SS C-terminal target domain-containing protein n=1 Tax=Marixanthomonas ophiurae TaxID=387659 RepID=A0A3E1Q8G4_9FLAO|nr:T9SS type A sorting domain-containing protein [Marixanthomonas ophiurae]RFN58423.1 T9SS C-terminal target domain-containing protein [Marixanthomonas ophiurae]